MLNHSYLSLDTGCKFCIIVVALRVDDSYKYKFLSVH
jgi:hypothetical protein